MLIISNKYSKLQAACKCRRMTKLTYTFIVVICIGVFRLSHADEMKNEFDCGEDCLTDPDCEWFDFNPTDKTCTMYNQTGHSPNALHLHRNRYYGQVKTCSDFIVIDKSLPSIYQLQLDFNSTGNNSCLARSADCRSCRYLIAFNQTIDFSITYGCDWLPCSGLLTVNYVNENNKLENCINVEITGKTQNPFEHISISAISNKWLIQLDRGKGSSVFMTSHITISYNNRSDVLGKSPSAVCFDLNSGYLSETTDKATTPTPTTTFISSVGSRTMDSNNNMVILAATISGALVIILIGFIIIVYWQKRTQRLKPSQICPDPRDRLEEMPTPQET